MIKTCLIIVPHPDDEVGVAGGIFDQMKENNIEVTVAICTNGDFVASNADVRIHEALKAKKKLGYENLIILGFGDNCLKTHIYETTNNEIIASHAGYKETYNAGGLKTFHSSKHGCQCVYTRDNYKNDIKELLLDVNADLLICVDTDNHPDHRAISLLFDEAIGELLKVQSFYPIILKKFAYVGAYFGFNDYFNDVMVETLPSFENTVDLNYSYPYKWEDRIRVENNRINYPLAFWKSSIFKSLLCHKSQNAYMQYVNLCNNDVIYWYRSTQSLTYSAQIEVSSGDASYLNDFKIVDTDNIQSNSVVIEPSHLKAWIPLKEDTKCKVKFSFANPTGISYIIIYQAPFSKVKRISVKTDKGNTFFFDCKEINILKIDIPIQRNVNFLDLYFFKQDINDEIVIYEIEIFEEKPSFPWDVVPLKKYDSKVNIYRSKMLLNFYSYMFILYHKYRSHFLRILRFYRWRIEYKINTLLKM